MVEPHHPAELQQFPKVEPWQVNPLVPPQVASVVTFLVAVAAADEEVLVEVPTTGVDERTEETTLEERMVEAMTDEERTVLTTAEELTPVHVPNPDWQPVPQ